MIQKFKLSNLEAFPGPNPKLKEFNRPQRKIKILDQGVTKSKPCNLCIHLNLPRNLPVKHSEPWTKEKVLFLQTKTNFKKKSNNPESQKTQERVECFLKKLLLQHMLGTVTPQMMIRSNTLKIQRRALAHMKSKLQAQWRQKSFFHIVKKPHSEFQQKGLHKKSSNQQTSGLVSITKKFSKENSKQKPSSQQKMKTDFQVSLIQKQ